MIEIKHRDTSVVLHTVYADTLSGADLSWRDLRWADLKGADLIGADLSKADLSKADLRGADLRKVDLREADLTDANLRKAYLTGAKLYGADLYGADLYGATICDNKLDRLIARATRLDGYEFFLFGLQDGSTKIKAGCRWLTVSEYRAHVARMYPDTDKARETLDIINFFEARTR